MIITYSSQRVKLTKIKLIMKLRICGLMYFTPGETGAIGNPALKAELHYCHYPIARVPPREDSAPQ